MSFVSTAAQLKLIDFQRRLGIDPRNAVRDKLLPAILSFLKTRVPYDPIERQRDSQFGISRTLRTALVELGPEAVEELLQRWADQTYDNILKIGLTTTKSKFTDTMMQYFCFLMFIHGFEYVESPAMNVHGAFVQ